MPTLLSSQCYFLRKYNFIQINLDCDNSSKKWSSCQNYLPQVLFLAFEVTAGACSYLSSSKLCNTVKEFRFCIQETDAWTNGYVQASPFSAGNMMFFSLNRNSVFIKFSVSLTGLRKKVLKSTSRKTGLMLLQAHLLI